jgi:D-glycero-D-manno-heptose 1,7-bisphosphate phosphatase
LTLWKTNPRTDLSGPVPALFLDRDGVLIADENYLADPAQVRLLPGVADALLEARRAGYLLICVSNQSGIGRGYFGTEELDRVMARLEELLGASGVSLDSYHYCPHAPDAGCPCRKPRPGMLEEASEEFPIDWAASWMIGDKGSDVAFGREHGMGGVLVLTGYGKAEQEAVRNHWATDARVRVADDLAAAVRGILSLETEGESP